MRYRSASVLVWWMICPSDHHPHTNSGQTVYLATPTFAHMLLLCPVVATRKQHNTTNTKNQNPKARLPDCHGCPNPKNKATKRRQQKPKPDCQIATLPDCQIAMVAEIRVMHDSDGICAPRAPIRAWFGADHARGGMDITRQDWVLAILTVTVRIVVII